MECSEFELRLQRQLDERGFPSDDPDCMGHIRQCSRCAQRLTAMHQICQVLKQWDRDPPFSTAPRRRWQAKAAVALAIAACGALIGIAFGTRSLHWMGTDRTMASGGERFIAAPREPVESAAADVPSKSAVAGAWPEPLARGPIVGPSIADAATSSLVYSAPQHWIEIPAVLANQVGLNRLRLEISDPLAPVTRSVNSALNVLRRPKQPAPPPQTGSEQDVSGAGSCYRPLC